MVVSIATRPLSLLQLILLHDSVSPTDMTTHRLTVDYYETLQIRDDADESTIKATYKRLALVKHPKKSGP